MVTMVTTKVSQLYFRCVKLFIHKISCSYQLYRRKYSTLVIVELCIYHFWRHIIYCSSGFAKLLKKQHFRFFCHFFLAKSPKSQSLKLNISRTAWPISMILVSFCRILNGRSDEINLFWALQFSFKLCRGEDIGQWLIVCIYSKWKCIIQIVPELFTNWPLEGKKFQFPTVKMTTLFWRTKRRRSISNYSQNTILLLVQNCS